MPEASPNISLHLVLLQSTAHRCNLCNIWKISHIPNELSQWLGFFLLDPQHLAQRRGVLYLNGWRSNFPPLSYPTGLRSLPPHLSPGPPPSITKPEEGSHLGGHLSGNRSQRTAGKSTGLQILLTWFQIPSQQLGLGRVTFVHWDSVFSSVQWSGNFCLAGLPEARAQGVVQSPAYCRGAQTPNSSQSPYWSEAGFHACVNNVDLPQCFRSMSWIQQGDFAPSFDGTNHCDYQVQAVRANMRFWDPPRVPETWNIQLTGS